MIPAVDPLLGLIVLVLALGGFTTPLVSRLSRNRYAVRTYPLIYCAASLAMASLIMEHVWVAGEPVVYLLGGWRPPVGILYIADGLSALLGVVTSLVMLLIMIYSTGYLEGSGREYTYYSLMLLLEAGMLGCIYTGDVFHLFVMLEVTSLSAYALVAYIRDKREALYASYKYAIYGGLATTIYFLAVLFIYGGVGSLTIGDIHLRMAAYMSRYARPVFLCGLVFTILSFTAFLYKAAVFPLHFWLPDAHPEAPSPVSAALSGLVVNIGVYGIVRFAYTIYHGLPDPGLYSLSLMITGGLGCLSSLVGAVLMASYRDVKRIIASSTIMNIGFMMMGYSTGSPLGIAASTLHLMNHSFAKSLAFLSSGVLIKSAGSRVLERLRGLGRALRYAGIPFAISLLSLAGVPLFNVFVSEYLLAASFIHTGKWMFLCFFMASYIISTIVYLRILYEVCLKTPAAPTAHRSGRYWIPVAAVLTALSITCIITGILSGYIISKIIMPASQCLYMNTEYLETVKKYLLNIH